MVPTLARCSRFRCLHDNSLKTRLNLKHPEHMVNILRPLEQACVKMATSSEKTVWEKIE